MNKLKQHEQELAEAARLFRLARECAQADDKAGRDERLERGLAVIDRVEAALVADRVTKPDSG